MKTRRLKLILELAKGSKQPLTCEVDILTYCNVTEEQLQESCRTLLPRAMIELEYVVLGKRAARARSQARIPDGSFNGRAPRAKDLLPHPPQV